jgi:DNA-binding beta-propeller fold protein YncE
MRRLWLACALLMIAIVFNAAAQEVPYRILKTIRPGGTEGFDYVYADEAARNLYVPRQGGSGRITVFNLDTLEHVSDIPNVSAHGVAVSPKSMHGFATSKPVAMWDAKTLAPIKTIEVDGSPDGILYDSFNDRVYVFSHKAPNATVIRASDGSVLGVIDLGGAPEQAVTDGQGRIYVDIEDKDSIAVIDAVAMEARNHYDLSGMGGTCAGLAIDIGNQILFASCRNPHTMVILSARDGKIITALPIGQGTDGAAFDPNTMEAFSSQSDGTLTVIKENSPTSFVVEQNVKTMRNAKTLTLDTQTNRVLLIAAEFGAQPKAAQTAGGYIRRGPMVLDSFSILEVGK